MSENYFDLPSRIEASFSEIDSDIVMNLRDTNPEYAKLQQEISEMKKQNPFISKVLEGNSGIQLTAEEHTQFVRYLKLARKLDDMERLYLYFRGHTDAVAYLKRIQAI